MASQGAHRVGSVRRRAEAPLDGRRSTLLRVGLAVSLVTSHYFTFRGPMPCRVSWECSYLGALYNTFFTHGVVTVRERGCSVIWGPDRSKFEVLWWCPCHCH